MTTSAQAEPRTGIWLIGARGSVATTVVAGCAAVAGGLQPVVGMVTPTLPCAECGLPDLGSLVLGGYDVTSCRLPKRAEQLAAQGVIPHVLPQAVREELIAADTEIRVGDPQVDDLREDYELINRFAEDIAAEAGRHCRRRRTGTHARRLRGRARRGGTPHPGRPSSRPAPRHSGVLMRTFDPSIHMTSRTTDDYEAMYAAGVRAVVEPSFWLGQPRTSPASDSMTPAEDTALAAQLQLAAAHGLPALVHTPHRDKFAGLCRTLDVVRESALPEEHVLIDHLNETTVKEAKDSGCWLGLSVHPDTKMDEERMAAILRAYGPEQVLVNSAADWGRSDPLGTRRVGDLMLAEGFTEDEVDRGLWCNPVAAYGLSGRLNLDVAATDATHEGNSILRGEA